MPIFEYKCSDCQSITEFLESSDEKSKHLCDSCGSTKTKKQFSTFAPITKQSHSPSNCHSCPSGMTCPNSQM